MTEGTHQALNLPDTTIVCIAFIAVPIKEDEEQNKLSERKGLEPVLVLLFFSEPHTNKIHFILYIFA